MDDPQGLTQLIFEAVRIAGVRVILSKGWGGIGEGDVPDHVYLVGDCPHDWLFQRVSCVVHHGGAGTTAAGLAAGCPTVVVPFFGDQPFWGQMIARAGAGPEPVPFKKIKAEIMAESILFALRPEVQQAAGELARQMAEEDGASSAERGIQSLLDAEGLRCDICPNRLAIWKHKKTDAHLSNLAAYYLINQGIIKMSHIQLLKHKNWYVDEGAETVLIGAIAACSGFFTEVGLATSRYAQSLKSGPPPRTRRKSSLIPLPSNHRKRQQQQQQQNSAPQTAASASEGTETATTATDDDTSSFSPFERDLTPKQLAKLARIMAEKPFKPNNPNDDRLCLEDELLDLESIRRQATHGGGEQKAHGRAHHILHATGHYAADLSRAGLKAPVAAFYNVANGFRNFPSYVFGVQDLRRRDEITGVKSGLKVAGKEFALGLYDAFTGVVVRPYKGAKEGGAKGLGKGLLRAGYGVLGGVGAGKLVRCSSNACCSSEKHRVLKAMVPRL